MGMLIYGKNGQPFPFDDRTLAHLQVVVGAKLRRGESFFLSWVDDPSSGGGRTSLWLSSQTPLYFKFRSSARPPINRRWIDELSLSANSAQGLRLTDEPDEALEAPAPSGARAVAAPRARRSPRPGGSSRKERPLSDGTLPV